MSIINIDNLKELAVAAKSSIWEQANSLDREPKIFLHWTAGHYGQAFDDYHICIDKDGSIDYMRDLAEPSPHGTFRRNTGSIQISIEGCCDSGSNDLGSEPPTNEQIESMAQCIAVIAKSIDIPIDKQHVLTHGEAANLEDGSDAHLPYAWWNDGYGDGDTRGDLEYLGTEESPSYNPYATDGTRGGDVLRGKANFYANKESE